MRVESDGHSQGNPRLYELVENAPKTGKSPTVWAFPEFVDFLKIAGQPVPGPWPPHQQPRPDPAEAEAGPVAVPDPAADTSTNPATSGAATSGPATSGPATSGAATSGRATSDATTSGRAES